MNSNDRLDMIISASTSNAEMDPLFCICDQRITPCAIVILGATGDLSARKLMPALFSLYLNGGLPDTYTIVGCGRTDLSDEAFRDRMEDAVSKTTIFNPSRWNEFGNVGNTRQ